MHKLLSAALLAAFSGGAVAASFPCDKAKTAVEHLICGSPELSQLDDDLARAYKASGPDDNYGYGKDFQRQWLAGRNKCKDEDCLRSAYQSRLRELRLQPLDAEDTVSGSYSFGKGNGYQGYARLVKLAPDRFRYEIYVTSGEPAWHTGGAAGEARITGKTARTIPASSACRMSFKFDGNKVKTEQQAGGKFGDCAVGARVTLDATFRKDGA